MAKSGLYTGVDIGTNTIKVLVAEYVSGEMNIMVSEMQNPMALKMELL
ncbi:Cell division protein FtsA [Lactococcus lactis]|nr:Cell division protein FtsA [Lactococcus lactis]